MDVTRMYEMLETLSESAKTELDKGLECLDTCEFGMVIDILKDLSEALYYRSVTKAMDSLEAEDVTSVRRYSVPYWHRELEHNRDMDLDYDRMYFSSSMPSAPRIQKANAKHYFDDAEEYMRDSREGKAGLSRKNYVETKTLHPNDSQKKLDNLDRYMKDLAEDVVTLYEDGTNEEKTMVKAKLQTLLQKM